MKYISKIRKIKIIIAIITLIGVAIIISAFINTEYALIKILAGIVIIKIGLYFGDKELIKIEKNIDFLLYKKKHLLTNNEYSFYQKLKPIAEELGYTILSKIRIADIVEVQKTERREWNKHFYKISNKHVDFAIVSSNSLEIILLIELDDNSHNYMQKDRDDFVNELYKTVGYKLLRVRDTQNLREKIYNSINESTT